MSRAVDVVVIGAGMFGSSAAKHLAQGGADVVVCGPAEPAVGRGDQHEFSAHFDEGRITRRLGWDGTWAHLDGSSLLRYRDIESVSGIEFFREVGSLVMMAGSIRHRTQDILARCEAASVHVEVLDATATGQRFPPLATLPLSGGVDVLLEPASAGVINPRRLVAAQLRLAEAVGARITRAPVIGVRYDALAREWVLGLREGGAIKELRAQRVLTACGAFTNFNGVLPEGVRLAMRQFTEPNLLFEVCDEQLYELLGLPTVVTVDPEDTGVENMSVYLLPPTRYPDGRHYVRIGPGMQPIVRELCTAEAMGAWYREQRVTAEQTDFLTGMAVRLLPELKFESVRTSACIIEKTVTRYPYLGPVEDSGTFSVAVGGNGHGARGCDETGRLAALLVLQEPWDCPLPASTFTPLLSGTPLAKEKERRSDALTPPFGLC